MARLRLGYGWVLALAPAQGAPASDSASFNGAYGIARVDAIRGAEGIARAADIADASAIADAIADASAIAMMVQLLALLLALKPSLL